MIKNESQDTVIAETAWLAETMSGRMRGMLGRRFDQFDAMIFERNNSIHSFFMGIPIDVIFLNREKEVIRLCEGLKPWRMAGCLKAKTVIECPVETIASSQTKVGDRLSWTADKRI